MERQNTSSHPILPPGFANSTFASTFTGIASPAGNVSNPLLMSTLHHLQGLSAAGSAAALLPATPQLALGGQFASEFNNIATMGWPAQNASAAWFEQAKAMLPMYGVLSATGVKSSDVPSVDANALTPPMRNASSQSANAPVLSASYTSSASTSGIFPLNPGGFASSSQDQQQLLSQPTTPQLYLSMLSNKASPADVVQVQGGVDVPRPSSIHSHHSSVEQMRPGSTSAMSTHGSNSVSVHSNVGSVEQLSIQQPGSVPPGSVPPGASTPLMQSSLDMVGASVRSSSVHSGGPVYQVVDVHGTPSHPASVEASTSVPTPGSQGSSVQQVAYDLTTSTPQQQQGQQQSQQQQPMSMRGPSLPNGHLDISHPSTSHDIMQDFAMARDQQTPGSSHENVLDAGSLEDLPWSSIDLGDIDLFGGASAADKDVMHSVLDMDPSVMHRILSNDPPTSLPTTSDSNKPQRTPPPSSSTAPMVQIVTPKIREKIKMRREKELADADKELDRLLSLVAKKDARTAPRPKIPPSLPQFDPLLFAKPEESDDKNITLSPVQFTPPDSPTPSTSTSVAPPSTTSFFFPTSQASTSAMYRTNVAVQRPEPAPSVTPYVFMPAIDKKLKCNKIPIYKQKTKSFMTVSPMSEDVHRQAADDAYSFTDDEEEKPLPSGATMSESQLREQKLELEVASKLAKINSAHPELKGKAILYEAQSQQDLWRHVVPKKRHTAAVAERPSVPSTPLLPPASASDQRADPSTSAQRTPEVLTLAESLQRRKQYRSSYGFLKTKSLDDKNTATAECPSQIPTVNIKAEPQDDYKSENGTVPQYRPLPKLLIRLPKRSVDESPSRSEKSKKKKKRKRKDRDKEWEGSDRKKKKKKHKHKHRKRSHDLRYEAHVITVEDDQWRNSEPANRPADMAVFSKKKRLMMQWNEGEEHATEPGCRMDETSRRRSHSGHADHERRTSVTDSEWSVPAKFSQADGHLTKGTFVVCKADILKEDCPLWRVDNQNLLQKYPPIKVDDKIVYKNSSTYSGWCDQIADGYLVVQVRFLKHTRSESVVEPELPLFDMFPAVSSELDEKPSQSDLQMDASSSTVDSEVSSKDPVRDHMVTYIRAMLNHGLTLSFLQAVKQGNDWNYLRALNDIDRLNEEKKDKVHCRVKWVERYIDMLHFYSSCVTCDAEGGGLNCQACGKRAVERVIQLFSNEGYDYDTLESEEMRYTGSGSPMPAMEYLVCSLCAKLSATYHKLHHMRYLLLKKCEDQMEAVSFENPDISSEMVVEQCMRNSKWLHSTINDYADLWRRIELNDC